MFQKCLMILNAWWCQHSVFRISKKFQMFSEFLVKRVWLNSKANLLELDGTRSNLIVVGGSLVTFSGDITPVVLTTGDDPTYGEPSIFVICIPNWGSQWFRNTFRASSRRSSMRVPLDGWKEKKEKKRHKKIIKNPQRKREKIQQRKHQNNKIWTNKKNFCGLFLFWINNKNVTKK